MVDERFLSHEDARKALNDLHDKSLNFDLRNRDEFGADTGWRVDDYCRRLPPEPPGPPLTEGSWEVACLLVRDYEFADPDIIRTIYYPDRPLEQRDMLLQARFYRLRLYLGVRVGGVHDETRTVQAKDVRVWGWNYRTLQGHLEMGQMDYEVWKWLDSGDVEFRIHALSRPADIRNPLLRLGFRLFGRRMQLKFARNACIRLERLTTAELVGHQTRRVPEPLPPTAGSVRVAPADARSWRGRRTHYPQ